MGMELVVTSGAMATLLEEAARAHPQECCGLLLGEGDRVAEARPAANVHPEPTRHFEIDPQALVDAFREGRSGGSQVVGYYHSHPNGHPLPSANDCEHAGDGRVWAIVAGGAVQFYRDVGGRFEPLPTRVEPG